MSWVFRLPTATLYPCCRNLFATEWPMRGPPPMMKSTPAGVAIFERGNLISCSEGKVGVIQKGKPQDVPPLKFI